VIRAASRALARRYHPDGITPVSAPIAALIRAYAHLKTHELRTPYDQLGRQPVAVGPAREASHREPYDPWRCPGQAIARALPGDEGAGRRGSVIG